MMTAKIALLTGALCSGLAMNAYSQSNVTLYGLINSGLTYQNNAKGSPLFKAQSGAWGGSRWGIQGSEDLGGGISSIFLLENGFDAYSGTLGQNGRMFGRSAWVGIASPWGKVTAGRQYEETTAFLGKISASGLWAGYIGSHIGDVDNVGATNRVDNTLRYETPDLAGLRVSALYRVGGTPGNIGTNEIFGLGASYVRGGLQMAAAYENVHNPATSLYDGTVVTPTFVSPASNPIFSGYESASDMRVIGAGATYQFGQLTVGAVYTNTQFRDVIRTASTPLAGSHTFQDVQANLTYRVNTSTLLGAAFDYLSTSTAHYSQAMFGPHYALSKRTELYAIGIYQHASGTNSVNKPAVASINTLTASSTPNQVAVNAGIIQRF
ncbi:porin [Caballeronia zhejiangensis]|nr:porin [Caballeronia zhejiangensis]KWU23799.1 hypothetical protein AS149_35220 [Burkholderia cenocepacia]